MYYLRTRAAADAIKFTVDQQALARRKAARAANAANPDAEPLKVDCDSENITLPGMLVKTCLWLESLQACVQAQAFDEQWLHVGSAFGAILLCMVLDHAHAKPFRHYKCDMSYKYM